MQRRRADERGAIAVMTAGLMVVVLGIAATAVDLGTQRVARRDMQAMADVVALDLSRLLNGRTAGQVRTGTVGYNPLLTARTASVERNDESTVGSAADLVVTPYLVDLDAKGDYATATDGRPVEVSDAAVPEAVVVVASTKVPFGFATSFGISSGSASRSAVGTPQSSACFLMGSYAAAIESGDASLLGPLNGLLGLNLQAVSYQGLAAADVSLADLAAQTTIGSVDELLNGNVTFGELTAATIAVLQRESPTGNAAAITALQAVRAALDLSQEVEILDVINVQAGDSAALLSQVNVLDLVAGTIAAANGANAIAINGLNVAGITGDLSVTQGIQRACGVPNDPLVVARSSQIEADLTVPLSLPSGTDNVLGLAVSGSARVQGGVGNAEGRLVAPPAVVCDAGTLLRPDTYRVDVNGGLLGLGVTADLTINGQVRTGLLGGLVDSLLGSIVRVTFDNVRISLGTAAPGVSPTVQHADLRVPQNARNVVPRGTPVKTGSAFGGANTVPTVTTATVVSGTITVRTGGLPLLGIGATNTVVGLDYGPVGGLISTLLGTVNGTLNTVVNGALVPNLNSLLTPLATLLGVNAGGADVFSESRPTCNGARLSG